MKQEDTSLSAQSKSAPTATAAAAPTPAAQHYKCKNCSRQFKTSRARCSHQITHRMASEMRMKPYGAVLGAVLINHIPSDDEDEINGSPPVEPELESAPKKGTGSSQIPAKVVTVAQTKAKGKEPATVTTAKTKAQAPPAKPKAKTSTTAGSSRPRGSTKKAPVLEKPDQQQEKKPQQPKQQQPEPEPQQQQTKDLLGEWSPMCTVRGEAEGSGSSGELTQDLGAARVLDEMRDDLDLELKLCSMNNNKVDLELRLGF